MEGRREDRQGIALVFAQLVSLEHIAKQAYLASTE